MMLNSLLKQQKNEGKTLEEILALIPDLFESLHSAYPNVTLEEIQEYVSGSWDSL